MGIYRDNLWPIVQNLHHTRVITPKRVTSGGAHLRDLAPGLHSSEKTSQPWRHCVDLTGPGIEPQTSPTDSVSLATELTAGLSAIIYCRLLISFKIVLIYRLLILLL